MEQRMPSTAMTALIPRGVFDSAKGEWIRKATVRSLRGDDELLIAELPSSMPLHSRVLTILERLIEFEGANAVDVLKKLSLGDRAWLLLLIRELLIGRQISCTADCPKCGKAMSLDISTDAIRSAAHPDPKVEYELEVLGFRLYLRPLTAEDQDVIVAQASQTNSLTQDLARKCILRSEPSLPENLPESLVEAVGKQLEEIDPISDVHFSLLCPECGHTFSSSLPIEEYVLRELAVHAHQLEREVHWLAFHYHWSEREILSLSAVKRRRYVELVNATLAGDNI
jgi:hypothetical protein